jgi:hypothetical protein
VPTGSTAEAKKIEWRRPFGVTFPSLLIATDNVPHQVPSLLREAPQMRRSRLLVSNIPERIR